MTPEQTLAYETGIEALKSYETPQYGDLRLNAARASAKVVMALARHGLVIVDAWDLGATVADAECWEAERATKSEDDAAARFARLRAAVGSNLPQAAETPQPALPIEADPTPAKLVARIADALNQLEDLDIDVQMPAQINALGSRVDAGELTFDRYADGERLATVGWVGDRWVVAPGGETR